MPKFKQGRIYIIVSEGDITTEMLNYSTSKDISNMPLKVVGGINKRILETTEPANSVYSSFTWYSIDEVMTAWDAL